MKISVGDYDSFKRVCAEVGPVKSVFYGSVGPTDIGNIVATTFSQDVYVQASTSGVSVATVLTDFPNAVEALNVDSSN
jgi:hypothetical protein